MLSRVMRKWDEDGVPDPDAIAFGEFILKVCPGPLPVLNVAPAAECGPSSNLCVRVRLPDCASGLWSIGCFLDKLNLTLSSRGNQGAGWVRCSSPLLDHLT